VVLFYNIESNKNQSNTQLEGDTNVKPAGQNEKGRLKNTCHRVVERIWHYQDANETNWKLIPTTVLSDEESLMVKVL